MVDRIALLCARPYFRLAVFKLIIIKIEIAIPRVLIVPKSRRCYMYTVQYPYRERCTSVRCSVLCEILLFRSAQGASDPLNHKTYFLIYHARDPGVASLVWGPGIIIIMIKYNISRTASKYGNYHKCIPSVHNRCSVDTN